MAALGGGLFLISEGPLYSTPRTSTTIRMVLCFEIESGVFVGSELTWLPRILFCEEKEKMIFISLMAPDRKHQASRKGSPGRPSTARTQTPEQISPFRLRRAGETSRSRIDCTLGTQFPLNLYMYRGTSLIRSTPFPRATIGL